MHLYRRGLLWWTASFPKLPSWTQPIHLSSPLRNLCMMFTLWWEVHSALFHLHCHRTECHIQETLIHPKFKRNKNFGYKTTEYVKKNNPYLDFLKPRFKALLICSVSICHESDLLLIWAFILVGARQVNLQAAELLNLALKLLFIHFKEYGTDFTLLSLGLRIFLICPKNEGIQVFLNTLEEVDQRSKHMIDVHS